MRKRRTRRDRRRQVYADDFSPGRRPSARFQGKRPAGRPSAPGRERADRYAVLRKGLSWVFQILIVVLFAYIVVFFYGQSRTVVGQSMEMTLQGGDTVLLDIFSYQIGTPDRGDIIAFRPNGSATANSNIKRVIGLPGETVQIKEGIIYINGQVLLEDRNYPVMTNPGMAEEELKLGSKEYFVLGDNRNNSEDSRFADIGTVNSDHIEGKVWFVLFPSENRGLLRD